MTTEMGVDLIESYLSARGVRYFRGHHDDEFFFLVNAYHGRLHVHLEPSGPGGESVTIRVTAERYYPADERARVASLADRWNENHPRAGATVFASSDPRLVGVAVERRYRSADADFGAFADETIQSAIDLFGRLGLAVGQGRPGATDQRLLDAG